MRNLVTNHLVAQEVLTETEAAEIQKRSVAIPISVHWELRTILYIGILLLTSGAGLLLYKNIDRIGHVAIVAGIGIACLSCYAWCFRKAPTFTWQKPGQSDIWRDYTLLLGSLLMVSFVAYLQFAFNIFGQRYGLATFVPMIILFASAYYFDHLGILSMAITSLAAWAGINATPLALIRDSNFFHSDLSYAGVALGLLLMSVAYLSKSKHLKAHFAFTYQNFGTHLLLIGLLTGMFSFERWWFAWFLVFSLAAAYSFILSFREKSYYFFVVTTLYSYVAISYFIVRLLLMMGDDAFFSIGLLYFIGSATALIIMLIRFNSKFRTHDRIS